MSEIVFLDRPAWRVTSRMIEVVGQRVPTAHVLYGVGTARGGGVVEAGVGMGGAAGGDV